MAQNALPIGEGEGVPFIPIIAEGPGWIVVNKPAGVPVHRGLSWDLPLVEILHSQLGRYVWPVHRLDQPVSGCLLVALTAEGVEGWAQRLAEGKKTYLALCRGTWRREGEVLWERALKNTKGVMQEAATRVDCIGTSEEPRCSLLRAWPKTGRYHQVRRHVRDLDHPIVGDVEHGCRATNRLWRENGIRRLALHCLRMELEGLSVQAPLPAELLSHYQKLPFWAEALQKEPELEG